LRRNGFQDATTRTGGRSFRFNATR
jgi:hypothetical protein